MEMLANGSIDGFIMSLSKETQLKGDFHIPKSLTKVPGYSLIVSLTTYCVIKGLLTTNQQPMTLFKV
jgi:hypothetical protein